jgi:hypothetical protein
MSEDAVNTKNYHADKILIKYGRQLNEPCCSICLDEGRQNSLIAERLSNIRGYQFHAKHSQSGTLRVTSQCMLDDTATLTYPYEDRWLALPRTDERRLYFGLLASSDYHQRSGRSRAP